MALLYFNELSIHGQFHDRASQHEMLRAVLKARATGASFGVPLRARRSLQDRVACAGVSVRQLISTADVTLRTLATTWLAKDGPFWDEDDRHSGDEYLECGDELVTDTGLGEAAFRKRLGAESASFGALPSQWARDPLAVFHVLSDAERHKIDVRNFTAEVPLRTWLEEQEPPLRRWRDLLGWATRLDRLLIAPDAVDSLEKQPFSPGAAERIQERLLVLHRVAASVDDTGHLSSAGQELFQSHFVGEKAWFTDSSDQEKVDFRSDLTFKHPANPEKRVFATWHGKVKTPQLRIHYVQEFRNDAPVYVVYIGPKLTKY